LVIGKQQLGQRPGDHRGEWLLPFTLPAISANCESLIWGYDLMGNYDSGRPQPGFIGTRVLLKPIIETESAVDMEELVS
jgi:hypothetical protein